MKAFGAALSRSSGRPLAAALAGLVVAGCTTTDFAPSGPPAPPKVAISVAELPGNWGLASYRTEADQARTEKEARAACGNPYVIGAGSNGGVVMHLPDQANPTEVFIKVAHDGNVYIGPRGAAGQKADRLVVSFSNGILISDWVDPSARERYGTMLFVRCAKQA